MQCKLQVFIDVIASSLEIQPDGDGQLPISNIHSVYEGLKFCLLNVSHKGVTAFACTMDVRWIPLLLCSSTAINQLNVLAPKERSADIKGVSYYPCCRLPGFNH